MTNEQSLIVTFLIGLAVVGAIGYMIPRWVNKGINVDGIIASASAGLAQADIITDKFLAAAPDNVGLQVADKLVTWSQQAVAAVEQLHKAHKLEGAERKAKAMEMVEQFATAAGIEVTAPLKDVIDVSIEAAVYVLPKTGIPETEPEPEDPPGLEPGETE
jgi:Phage holin protein (Holin_LLH).